MEGLKASTAKEVYERYRSQPWHTSKFVRDAFALLWCLLHGEDAWNANPPVTAYPFAAHICDYEVIFQRRNDEGSVSK